MPKYLKAVHEINKSVKKCFTLFPCLINLQSDLEGQAFI